MGEQVKMSINKAGHQGPSFQMNTPRTRTSSGHYLCLCPKGDHPATRQSDGLSRLPTSVSGKYRSA